MASMLCSRRGSPMSIGWRAMACITSSGTWVGPGEWRNMFPGMAGVACIGLVLFERVNWNGLKPSYASRIGAMRE